jgi:hypothetical protein
MSASHSESSRSAAAVSADQALSSRRAQWPLWMFTAAVLGATLWAGLVLGGYLRVPAWLYPAAEFWWDRS